MKKTNFLKFLKDEKARVPFSVIGVFLILGSSLTTVYISNLENQKSLEIAGSVDSSDIENLLRRAEADISTALNIAGMKGLKIIGEKPVITVDGSHDYGTDASEVNKNRTKQIIMDNLNEYLKNNYYNNRFNDSGISLNVVIKSGETYPINSRDQITIDDNYKMKVKRKFTLEFMGPPESEKHKTYWKAILPLDIEIKKINPSGNDQLITTRTINPEALITSRYNLLKELTNDYQQEIDGTPCSLWTYCTGLFNIYSLARGFQHHKGGKPKNIVDNDDLHPMVNSGLLMQQGFVFGSVDAFGLANVVAGAFGDPSFISKNKKKFDNCVNKIENTMETGSDYYKIVTDNLSKVSSDGSDPTKNNLNYNPQIDISKIARDPIEKVKSIILEFNGCKDEEIKNPTQEKINDTVDPRRKLGYEHVNTKDGVVEKNQTTVNFIDDLIQEVYTADFKTDLERADEDIFIGDHDGYPIDNGTTNWVYKTHKLINSIPAVHIDPIQPGDILYKEKYEVEYTCNHFWSNKTTDKDGNVTWNETITQDTKTETLWLKEIVVDYCETNISKNDVFDIFKKINLPMFIDFNLENTAVDYKTNTFTNSNINSWIKDPANSGTMHTGEIEGLAPILVDDLCWDSLKEIYNEVKKIKQDPDINPSNYPNPSDLLKEAKNDLLTKFRAKKSTLLSKSDYIRPDGEFKSATNKAIYQTREWYVNKIETDIQNYLDGSVNEINNQISDALKDTDAKIKDVENALSSRNIDQLKKQLEIPLGYDMPLKGTEWNEDIKILVDHEPDYLTVDEEITDRVDSSVTYYPLKLRNRCLFGPTGIPILPTPVTPWVFTFNIWIIDVEGEYTKFKIMDKTDETIYNVTGGHEAQVYIRQHEVIKSPDTSGITIGENTRINFAWTTVATSFVPPMGHMVGDTEGDIWNEHTDGFD